MKSQGENRKRKELKDWKKPELEVLDTKNTYGGSQPGIVESATSFGIHGSDPS